MSEQNNGRSMLWLDVLTLGVGVACIALMVDRAVLAAAGRHLVTSVEGWLDRLDPAAGKPTPESGEP